MSSSKKPILLHQARGNTLMEKYRGLSERSQFLAKASAISQMEQSLKKSAIEWQEVISKLYGIV